MTLITKSEELMAVSVRQGVELAAIEAKVLLGYLEGHDYSLMMDDNRAAIPLKMNPTPSGTASTSVRR